MADSLGIRVAELRKRKGWSQDQLAEAAGVHKNTVLHAEKTGDVRTGTLTALASALDVSVAELFPGAPKRRRRKAG